MRVAVIVFLIVLAGGNAADAGADIVVSTNGWGEGRIADIRALLNSAMAQFAPHFGDAAWPGICVFHSDSTPITLNVRGEDGRVRIGLNTRDRFWSQYTFQFSHEMVHLIVRHLHADTERRALAIRAGWIEESLCEAGSLFALRSMSRCWETNAPYPNWVDYRNKLVKYAEDRIEVPENCLPAGMSFDEWLKSKEACLRTNSYNRAANTIVAKQLLPVFERHPRAWNALVYLLSGDVQPSTPTDLLLINWRNACPEDLRPYVNELAERLGVPLDNRK